MKIQSDDGDKNRKLYSVRNKLSVLIVVIAFICIVRPEESRGSGNRRNFNTNLGENVGELKCK